MTKFFSLFFVVAVIFSLFFISRNTFGIKAKLSLYGQDYHVDTYQDYLAFMNQLNRSTDPELVNYREPIPELHELAEKCSVTPHVMLTTNFFIGATHVVRPGLYWHLPGGTGYIKAKYYHHPNPALDLTLFVTRKHYPQFTPMKRYFGSDLSGSDFYAYSPALHHRNGHHYQPNESGSQGLYTKGPLTLQQNNSVVYLQNPYQGPKLQLSFVGGDSSAPVFKRVSHTGDVFKDFCYFGFNNTGNPNIKVINASSPEVSPWITNTIIAEALGSDRPSYIIESPLDERSQEEWRELWLKWREFFSPGNVLEVLSYAGGILIDPSWLIGLSEKDFLDPHSTAIKKVRFSTVNDYVNTNQQTERLELAKVVDLGDGRSMARLKQPYLGRLPMARFKVQENIARRLSWLNSSSSGSAVDRARAEAEITKIMQIVNKIQNIIISEALAD